MEIGKVNIYSNRPAFTAINISDLAQRRLATTLTSKEEWATLEKLIETEKKVPGIISFHTNKDKLVAILGNLEHCMTQDEKTKPLDFIIKCCKAAHKNKS